MRRLLALAVAGAAVALGAATAASVPAKPTFLTPQPAMLTPVAAGSEVKPIITVGEHVGDYRFEAIPDGISLLVRGPNKTDIWVNHETSTVPFPYVSAGPTISNSQNDFDNAQLSHLVLRRSNAEVLEGSFVIPSSANFQRFCSNFLAASREQGFRRPLLFTNEEASDLVNRTGDAWPPGPEAEQAGLVVAYDPRSDEYRPIYGLGRMNHENTVAVPGYDGPVLVTGDDTFNAPSSQLYLYTGRNRAQVWNDRGRLWAFRSDIPSINDYGDLSGSDSVSGHFLQVPEEIAKGDQTGLEDWSNRENVFQFIRVEDIAYDRNHSNVIYFADTGEPRAIADPTTGRLKRGPSGTEGPYPNGRVFKMVLDPADPTTVLSLSILIDADTGGYRNPDVLHQPDNLETTANSLLVQEDPGSHNQFTAGTGPNARIWRYKFESGSFEPVAMVDQSADPSARAGAWESSGIVDASSAFGPGAFLVDVQAHTLFVETAPGPDLVPPPGPDWLYKREGGQLLLFRLPDS
jgi:hypothetical protein